MKRTILLLTILLFALPAAKAQVADGKVKIDGLTVTEQGDRVTVGFTADIDRKAVGRNNTLVFGPVLTDGQYSISLPSIIIQGKGSKASQQRREWVAGTTYDYPNAIFAGNGQKVQYTAIVTSQEWMDGANLRMESVLGGCCNYNRQGDLLLANNIDLQRTVYTEPEPEIEPEWVPVTVADKLSTAFTFVVPDSEWDEAQPFKIYDDERENSLVVYYKVGKYEILPEYMDNAHTLGNLSTAINMILNSTDSRVTRIVVAGFASPEGSLQLNDQLAFERAVSVKQHLMQTTSAKDSQIVVYNGSVDWRGLRSMVMKSNLPEKNEIVNIIDNTPIWDSQRQVGRLGELMRLNGGRTYRYLLNEYFPYLRNGAFIKVFYENN